MINLLFISNSPRAELLRVHFQQMLKIRIDVVEDFDHGLKDVFEKRPVAVCIQEQIAGVTGESVARHIQLLLGNGAPDFILMHEGNAKAKQVPGLFGYVIDLQDPFEVVCGGLRKALQSLLGASWDTIYSAPPEQNTLVAEPESIANLADQVVEEFVAENAEIAAPQNDITSIKVVSQADGVSSAFVTFDHDLPGGPPAEPLAAKVVPPISSSGHEALEAPVPRDPLMAGKQPPAFLQQKALERPVRSIQQVSVAAPSASELSGADDGSVPVEALLQVFEDKYRSRKRMIRWAVVVLISLLLLGAVFVWLKKYGVLDGQSAAVIKQHLPERPDPLPAVQPVISSVKSAAPTLQPVIQKAVAPLSFIAQAKPDTSFSSKKPGWSRYLSARRDYRLFHADGRLQALQVIAIHDSSIPLSELKQVLRELTGKEQYRSGRKEHKRGVWLERATIPEHGDLLIYRPTSSGPIKAFVYAPPTP